MCIKTICWWCLTGLLSMDYSTFSKVSKRLENNRERTAEAGRFTGQLLFLTQSTVSKHRAVIKNTLFMLLSSLHPLLYLLNQPIVHFHHRSDFGAGLVIRPFPILTRCVGGRHNMPPHPCDLLTLKVVSKSSVMWATSVSILVFLFST